MPINYPNLIITEIDAEIDRLTRVRKLLAGTDNAPKPKHMLSAAARARISAAQKKRWAQQKSAAKG